MILEDVMSRQKNNFDLIRFFAAVWVIWDHSFVLSSKDNLNYGFWGYVVPLFGFISGLVIVNSILRKKKPLNFLISISSRIYIPLVLVTFFCAFVLAPVFSIYSPIDYFKFNLQESIQYFVNNCTFHFQPAIDGVFADNRYPTAVNGNLWCLSYFFGCYLFILILYLFGALKDRWGGR